MTPDTYYKLGLDKRTTYTPLLSQDATSAACRAEHEPCEWCSRVAMHTYHTYLQQNYASHYPLRPILCCQCWVLWQSARGEDIAWQSKAWGGNN